MYGGDRSRKITLVDYGFRLPSAIDNRPLKFEEFENITGQTIYVSAGIRGLQIKIAPADLIKAAEATVGEIVR